MKAAALLMKALEAEGVHCIFGVPGEEDLDLVEALRESSIRLIVTHRKRADGFMPDDGVLCLDEGTYPLWYARHYRSAVAEHRIAGQHVGNDGRRPALGVGGVHLIDPVIDYSDNHRILDEQICALSAAV